MRFGEIFTTALFKFSKYPTLLTVGNFKTFLYAMFLTLMMLAGIAVTLYPAVKKDGVIAEVLRDELPDFECVDGELKCENTVLDEGDIYIEVDTTKDGVLPLPDGYRQSMMISRTDLHMLNQSGQEQHLSFSDLPDFSKDSVLAFLNEHSGAIFAVILACVLFYLLISMAVSMLLYAAVAFFADKLFIHSSLHFGAVFKLTVFGMTFSVLLNMIFTAFGLRSVGMLAPFITLFYVIKGILSCKQSDGIVIEELS